MLPVMTKIEDVLAVVAYLKTKATGATLNDAKATLPARVLDARKIAAYDAWGLVTKEGDRLRLTSRGRQLARASDEHRSSFFGEIILEVRAYRIAAEWIHHRKMSLVPLTDLAAHWFDHVQQDLGTKAEKTIRYQVACFFGLADAAGLGEYFVGRRGQPTRLEVDHEALGQLIAGGELSPDQGKPERFQHEDRSASLGNGTAQREGERGLADRSKTRRAPSAKAVRVFISHGPNVNMVDQVKTMLELSDLEYEVVVEQESTAIPVPDKVFDAMRRCNAAVICVTADDIQSGATTADVNPNVLIEIGAAFLLYEKRVALVWDRRIPVPSNLQGLYRCEFEGKELSWSAGMKLLKAVKEFKNLG